MTGPRQEVPGATELMGSTVRGVPPRLHRRQEPQLHHDAGRVRVAAELDDLAAADEGHVGAAPDHGPVGGRDLLAPHLHGAAVRARPLDLSGDAVVPDHAGGLLGVHVRECLAPRAEVLARGVLVADRLWLGPVIPDEVVRQQGHPRVRVAGLPGRHPLVVEPLDVLLGHTPHLLRSLVPFTLVLSAPRSQDGHGLLDNISPRPAMNMGMPSGAPISVNINTPPVMNIGKPIRIPSNHGRSGHGWALIAHTLPLARRRPVAAHTVSTDSSPAIEATASPTSVGLPARNPRPDSKR